MNDRTLRVLEYPKIIEMLASHTRSPMGRARALSLHPFADRTEVRRLLEETSEAEAVTAAEGGGIVPFFPDIAKSLNKARIGSILSPLELLQIGQVLSAAYSVKERMRNHRGKAELNLLPPRIEALRVQPELLEEIKRCIESEERISDHASPELSSVRRQIARCHERVREKLNGILHSAQYQKMLQELIITIRNDRYVVPVKQEHRTNFPGIVHDQSGSGATLFIEPMGVVETNNELRRHQLAEEKEIERILAMLTAQVDSVGGEIGNTLSMLAELDLIFAKGAFSLALRGICPMEAEGGVLRIAGGRHPLIPNQEVVPITLELGRTFDALVITGPNTGGKTVTLKTAGLFVLMAQSGLHVPADYGTEMGIFHQVYADIGDEQSIEQSLSTFSSHMTNIVDVLKHARPGDLVLFDELGAGTDPTEGAALAMSILDFLHGQGIAVMATTHYSELKLYALSKTGVENASVEFDVETLRPTYRLMLGIPGKSNAFEISRRLGLEGALIDGAKAYLSQEDIRFEDIMGNIARDRSLAEAERELASQARQEMDRLRAQLKREQAELESNKAAQLRKAKEEARRLIREARDMAEEMIRDLRQLGREADEKARNKAIEDARKKLRAALGGLEEGFNPEGGSEKAYGPASTLRLGQTVYITILDQKGQVLTLPDAGGEVQVQIGIMKMTVSKDHLRQVIEASEPYVKLGRGVTPRAASVTSELDLRGENAEEALLRTDHYLDDAFLAGLSEVTLIHGKGTGILRSAIHQQLRQHPHVASFRLGRYGEGESGVTMVQLK